MQIMIALSQTYQNAGKIVKVLIVAKFLAHQTQNALTLKRQNVG